MSVDLDELERLLGAMTPGEWWQGHVEKYHVFAPSDFAPPAGRVLLRANEHFPYEADLAGIVALRNASPAILAELREARRLDDRMREQLAFLDKAIAEGRFPGPPRTVCAHCQAEHDVESGAMAAHVRECDRNPMIAELRALRAERDGLRAEVEAMRVERDDARADLAKTIDEYARASRAGKEG